MNRSHRNQADGGRRPTRHLGKLSSIGIVAAIVLYAVLQPVLNERLNLNLPSVAEISGQSESDSAGEKVVAQTDSNRVDSSRVEASDSSKKTNGPPAANSDRKTQSKKQPSESKPRTANDPKPASSTTDSSQARGPPAETKTSADSSDSESELLYGLLKEVSPKRYLSPAGLIYGPGSQEGHRLEHLRRHTKDMPSRRGKHGVFDGEMEGALATIDKAYERAQKGQRTTKSDEGERTVYTVDMGNRVGFVGGSVGKQQRNPMARRVRIVVEGSNVITAFPL